MTAATLRPSRIWYAIAAAVFVVAGLGGPIIGGVNLLNQFGEGTPFLVPGQQEVHIARPGKYVLWNDYQTIHNGRTYAASEDLPAGAQIQLLDADTGAPIPMSANLTSRVSVNGAARRSIGAFQLDRPGRYRIVVDGDFPARVFSFREARLGRVLTNLFLAGTVTVTGWIAAPVMALLIFFRRRKARQLAAATAGR